MDPTDAPPEGRHSLCVGLKGTYSVSLHIGAACLVLVASAVGAAVPLLAKHITCLRSNVFALTLLKTASTGVLLSVSCIHLLHEAVILLEEPCVPAVIRSYRAFAFLIALIAVLLMQALDSFIASVAEQWMRGTSFRQFSEDESNVAPAVISCDRVSCHDSTREGDGGGGDVGPICRRRAPVTPPASHTTPASNSHMTQIGGSYVFEVHPSKICEPGYYRQPDHSHDYGSLGHQHFFEVPEDMDPLRRIVTAISMEFGVTLHSIFVGLAVGLTTDHELKPLLIALLFHQLFEGMAMGSRLTDASFHFTMEIGLAIVFTLSAPVGMAAATVAVISFPAAMSGTVFVTVMAMLDAICGGILLYLAFTLLLIHFPADVSQFGALDKPCARGKRLGLYAALWFGVLLMALIGHWL